MEIYRLEPFISDTVFVFAQLGLAFGVMLWFGISQIRATRRSREEEVRPSSLAADARPSRLAADARPSRIAADARPSRIAADARPSRLAADARPSRLAADTRRGQGPSREG